MKELEIIEITTLVEKLTAVEKEKLLEWLFKCYKEDFGMYWRNIMLSNFEAKSTLEAKYNFRSAAYGRQIKYLVDGVYTLIIFTDKILAN